MPILLRVLVILALSVVLTSTGWHAHAMHEPEAQTAQVTVVQDGASEKSERSDHQHAPGGCVQISSDCSVSGVLLASPPTIVGRLPIMNSLASRDSVALDGVLLEFEPPPPRV